MLLLEPVSISVKSAESVFKKINTDLSDLTDASPWASISVKSAESVFRKEPNTDYADLTDAPPTI